MRVGEARLGSQVARSVPGYPIKFGTIISDVHELNCATRGGFELKPCVHVVWTHDGVASEWMRLADLKRARVVNGMWTVVEE